MNKYYITTSIAYANAEPHIGFAQELLAGDILARFHRAKGDDTYFLTGTDEHGGSVVRAAEKAKVQPEEYVKDIAKEFLELTKTLNITNDDFIRTTNPEHIKNVIEIWEKVNKAGYIYKKEYEGLYCVGCEAFLNKRELVNGKCPRHPSLTPEKIKEENWFFKLSAFNDFLKEFYEKNSDFVKPQERYNELKSLVNEGLEDISISRPREKLSWGIEVPNDKTHVMYVWFDALTNYLYPKKYWPAQLHIIGKDILRFHGALWPAMLKAAGEELPKRIFVHGFISVDGQKMSKTLGNVIQPKQMIEKYGVEGTRYLLLRELGFEKDGDFSWGKMTDRYNADLANDLGNLLQRTLVMAKKYKLDIAIEESGSIEKADKYLEELKFSESLAEIWKVINKANKYIEDKKPWELAKREDKTELKEVIRILFKEILKVANSLEYYMHETVKDIREQLETKEPKPLFPRFT